MKRKTRKHGTVSYQKSQKLAASYFPSKKLPQKKNLVWSTFLFYKFQFAKTFFLATRGAYFDTSLIG